MLTLIRRMPWTKPSEYSRNGQRLPRRTCNGFDCMEVIALRFGLRRSWSMVNGDRSRFGGEAPQPYSDRLERHDIRENPEAKLLRQDNKGLMREEAVAPGLSQSLAPVRQFALEGTGGGPDDPSERFDVRETLRRKCLPRHDVQVSNSIAVDGDFTSECERCLAASPMNLFGLLKVRPRERNRKAILRGGNPFSARKVMPRLAESQLWHRYQRLTHVHVPVRLVSVCIRGSREPRIPPLRAATIDRRPLHFPRLPISTIPYCPCRVHRSFKRFLRSG